MPRTPQPRPDASLSFSLAAATAFLELLGPSMALAVQDAQAMIQVRQILAAQQVATIACTSAIIAASSAAHP